MSLRLFLLNLGPGALWEPDSCGGRRSALWEPNPDGQGGFYGTVTLLVVEALVPSSSVTVSLTV